MDKSFKVRDLRNKDQFKIDDAYLNGYAKLCGVYATAVYNSLSRHANFSTQECWPAIKLIAEQHNISQRSVIRGIKALEKWQIIMVVKEKDSKTKRQKNNVYCLVDKSMWLPKSRVTDVQSGRVTNSPKPGDYKDKSRVTDVQCKDYKLNDNKKKDYILSKEIKEKMQKLKEKLKVSSMAESI